MFSMCYARRLTFMRLSRAVKALHIGHLTELYVGNHRCLCIVVINRVHNLTIRMVNGRIIWRRSMRTVGDRNQNVLFI